MQETPRRPTLLEELLATARQAAPPPPIAVHIGAGATVIIYAHPPGMAPLGDSRPTEAA